MNLALSRSATAQSSAHNQPDRTRSAVVGLGGVRRAVRIIAACLCVTISATACTTIEERATFTAAEQERAEMAWLSNTRIWGDAPAEDILAWAGVGGKQGRPLPTLTEQPVVLALSGGGEKGAFGAGLLEGWTDAGTRPEFTFVTGVSTGALMAPLAFLGPKYDHMLRDAYQGVTGRQVFRERNPLSAIFGPSLVDPAPLRKRIAAIVDRPLLDAVAREWRRGRGLFVLTTNLDAQRPVIWNIGLISDSQDPRAVELVRDVLLASASIPGAFPAVPIEAQASGRTITEFHGDGGVTAQILLIPETLLIAGLPKGQSTVYAVVNNSLAPEFAMVRPSTVALATRGFSTLIKSQSRAALAAAAMLARQSALKLEVAAIRPDFRLKSDKPFDPRFTEALWSYGYQLGRSGAFASYGEISSGAPRRFPNSIEVNNNEATDRHRMLRRGFQ